VVKALFTDRASRRPSLGVQVYGGHGYIREHGPSSSNVRDARIAMLYEGTNGIQRSIWSAAKMPAHMGRSLRRLFHPISDFIEAHRRTRLGRDGRAARAGRSARYSWQPGRSRNPA